MNTNAKKMDNLCLDGVGNELESSTAEVSQEIETIWGKRDSLIRLSCERKANLRAMNLDRSDQVKSDEVLAMAGADIYNQYSDVFQELSYLDQKLDVIRADFEQYRKETTAESAHEIDLTLGLRREFSNLEGSVRAFASLEQEVLSVEDDLSNLSYDLDFLQEQEKKCQELDLPEF